MKDHDLMGRFNFKKLKIYFTGGCEVKFKYELAKNVKIDNFSGITTLE